MRFIGKFDSNKNAGLFSDFLLTEEIENKVLTGSEQEYEIWVQSEDDLERAREYFNRYCDDPGLIDAAVIAKKANAIRKSRAKNKQHKNHYIDVRTQVFYRSFIPQGGMTLVLIIISVALSLLTRFGADYDFLRFFLIADVTSSEGYIRWSRGLLEIQHGQFWRLLTPIFLHFGIIHLLFNMLWLNDLGSMVEDRLGTWYLSIFIIVTAICSNLGQYLVSGPLFGGMSGVVYALLGFIWMRSKYDHTAHFTLDKRIVIMMIIWFGICFTGLVGNVANAAHAIGFIVGIVWGYLTSASFIRLLKQYF
ncbi:rhomboid family intramembrane serine protease [bacterium]|nr:rhomboid family intramembrane serine protease [bacterium]